jgi:NDP-sugar pyrophosphorylase family protein
MTLKLNLNKSDSSNEYMKNGNAPYHDVKINPSKTELPRKRIAIIPAAGDASRFNSIIPKPLFPINGKPTILRLVKSLAPWCEKIIILIKPSHRNDFEKSLENYNKKVQLVDYTLVSGEGRVVLDALDYVNSEFSDIVIAWSDLAVTSQEKIKFTLEMHSKYGAAMTFPTMPEKKPYVAIMRDNYDRVCKAAFKEYGDIQEMGEHDCSFFIVKFETLKSSLISLHNKYYCEKEQRYDFQAFGAPPYKKGEFKFLYIIQELYKNKYPIKALPICIPNEFLSFNTLEEAMQIEKKLSEGDL